MLHGRDVPFVSGCLLEYRIGFPCGSCSQVVAVSDVERKIPKSQFWPAVHPSVLHGGSIPALRKVLVVRIVSTSEAGPEAQEALASAGFQWTAVWRSATEGYAMGSASIAPQVPGLPREVTVIAHAAYAGRPLAPGPLSLEGDVLGDEDLEGLVVETVKEGCVGETLASYEAWMALARTDSGLVQRTHAMIADDEARHAELAWAFVRWAIDRGGESVRRAAREAF